jgi:cytochrome c oxidase assembly protein subunit 11
MSGGGGGDVRARRQRAVGLAAAGLVALMIAASYAAVPLYSYLCRTTNFDGTPRRAAEPSRRIVEQSIEVRFDANVAPGLAWRFEPVQRTLNVKLGENVLAFYRATNISHKTQRGIASFNVLPEQSAAYFNKVQCFCFTEQELRPGEVAEFPVSFYIDPQITSDKDARDTRNITLSYTFHPLATPKPGLTAEPGARQPGAPTVGAGSG